MKIFPPTLATALAPVLALALVAGCSSQQPADSGSAGGGDAATATPATSAPTAAPTPTPTSPGLPSTTLRLEGLGDLAIGQPLPAASSFAVRGAQIPGSSCKIASSPDYPDVYALIEQGEVRRITVSGDSRVRLVEGIGPGSSEAEARQAFPGFVATPHKYVEAPAKYLTQPGKDPRLEFEIDHDGKVSAVHVGLMPQLAYVEGCA
ncbi:MAG: hypothetical protein IE933_15015 [Sphingomonadales bacterium]|nr:hypothetical protein [Sphingomonadales bacterium]MBD3773513.1 hypothetical protein [Paracoccaceae bacterium]